MGTHYHLVIETPQANVVRGMRQLNGVYAQGFNRRHARHGHLLGGRYGTVLVARDEHLLEVLRYVVLNPVRARLCKHPAEWPWSSYRATAGLDESPAFLALDWVLRQFAPERASAQARYEAFVAEPLVESPWAKVRGGIYLGEAAFVRRHEPRAGSTEVARRQREPLRVELRELLRGRSTAAIAVAYREHRFLMREIAAELDVHVSTVSRRLRDFERAGDRLAGES